MKPSEVVIRLAEMRTEVQRMMPHIECVGITPSRKCFCYKHDLLRALTAAELDVRIALGLEPF